MPWSKGTLFYSLGQGGWSESWFFDNSDPNQVGPLLTQINQSRLPTLSVGAKYLGYRVSAQDPAGLAYSVSSQLAANSGLAQDIPSASLFVKCYASNGQRRQLMMRGLPDSISVNGQYAPSTAFAAALTSFFNQLQAQAARLRVHDLDQPKQACLSIDATGKMTLPGANTLAKGNFVKFYRARTTAGGAIRKVYQILDVVGGTQPVLNGWPAGQTALNINFYKLVFKLLPINLLLPQSVITTRRVGRPFGLVRGRASKRPTILV